MTEIEANEPNYEEMITELREIARKLDNPNTSVEDAVKAELTITEVHGEQTE